MSKLKSPALIAAGYVLSVGAGLAAVAVNELLMPADVAQGSPGMVAFGDMILFVLVAGLFSLVPTWFLLKLLVEKAPRTLLAIVLLVAVLGPASWLAVKSLAGGASPPSPPQAIGQLLGLFIAFVAIPRMVFGPVLLVIEGVTFFLVREGMARAPGRGNVDGPRPSRHLRAAYGRRGPLLDVCQRCSGAAPGH